MRYTTLLPFVAAATAIVIPDEVTLKELALTSKEEVSHKRPAAWWDSIPSLDHLRASVEDAFSATVDTIERTSQSILDSLPEIEIDSELSDFLPAWERPGRGGRHGHHHPTENLTIYEAIQKSNFTKKFAKLIDDFPDLVKTLNSTSHNSTIFVPIDKAFDKIPEGHETPPKEIIEKILEYHVLHGVYPASRVLHSHTLPTELESRWLGGKPQRLRARFGLGGVHINFYSRVIAANIPTTNGLIHGVNNIILPPPPASKIISLFPSKFSTLILAAKKSGLAKELHGLNHTGGTVFAPNNVAFDRLGPRANAFLFNTEKGLGYLKALLKYHLVANETLYSDAYYGKDKDEESGSENGHSHVDLPTLLGDKTIAVDIARWGGFIDIKLNGYVHVAVQDVVAADSVVHVLTHVLIPPHKHRGKHDEDAEIEVEDLVERLGPYVENQKDYPMGEL